MLQEDWHGTDFFGHFSFFSSDDPTHGTVEYEPQTKAEELGLIKAASNRVLISVDTTHVISAPSGRPAVRIESLRTISSGQLVSADVTHVPTGCGTWPALWLCGPDWPNGGEIDLFEVVNTANRTQTTLHTSGTCDQSQTTGFTGTWSTGTSGQPATDCWVDAPGQYGNQGCGIVAAQGTAGAEFNSGNGGVFAAWWSADHIAAWFWRHGNVPKDLLGNMPQPESWGLPYARFDFGANCKASYFQPQTLVINTALCGDWAGSTFAHECPGYGDDCPKFARSSPKAFTEAYWEIASVKIFGPKM